MEHKQEIATHPSFLRAQALAEPLRSHFPKCQTELGNWEPIIHRQALASRVLVVAKTRIECAWSAYVDAVPGVDYDREEEAVLRRGTRVGESLARLLFPRFNEIPYAP